MFNTIGSYTQNNNYNRSNVAFGAKPVAKETALYYINKIKDSGAKRIHLHGHSSLDNDSYESENGLSQLLKAMGVDNYVCAKNEQLKGLFLSRSKEIYKGDKQPDLIVTLDFNDIKRVPKLYKDVFEKNKGNIIGLDHHLRTDTMKGDFYIDETAKSCSGIVFRFAEALGVKLRKRDYRGLYCGMLSDYQKSKLIKFEDGQLIKMPELYEDKNSLEVLEKVEKLINNKDKAKVFKYLDIMSNLTPKEMAFRDKLPSMVQVSPNGKLAYVAIDPKDKQWAGIGMDNDRTSAILRDLRLKMLDNSKSDIFNQKQKQMLKNAKAAIIFYRTSSKSHGCYQMSLHSKDSYAEKIIKYIKTNLDPELEAGGHENRAGGRVHSVSRQDANQFVNLFIQAAEKIQ